MQYQMRKPAPPLADCVDHIWWWKGVESPHDRESVLPDGSMELIIDLDDEPKHIYPDGQSGPTQSCRQTWLSGIQPTSLIIGAAKGGEMIGIIALFERRPWSYVLVNGGYMTVALLLKGTILGAWR